MDEFLQRLESQKAKLPPEDHSIIDWGISFVQAKMLEEEQLMDTFWKDYDTNADLFNDNLKKVNLDLNVEKLEEELWKKAVKEFFEKLVELIYLDIDDSRIENQINHDVGRYKGDLKIFLEKEGKGEYFQKIIKKQKNRLTEEVNDYDKAADKAADEGVSEEDRKNLREMARIYRDIIPLLEENR